jgi:YHS domain-containing protein
MKTNQRAVAGIAVGFCVMLLTMALSTDVLAVAKTQAKSAKRKSLVQVQNKYVCMINNQRFNKEQIPVQVEGQTYYGCCDMCKAKLQGDVESRFAVDPVSGKKVDKAKAIIGADADGVVYYFESLANMKKYKPAAK